MSQEKVLKVLSDLGLTRLDSKIYIYLAKNGPKEGKEISRALKVQRPQLYRSLKTLQKKAIVSATLERPAKFSAVSFERAVDLFIRTKLEEAQKIQNEKSELLSSWQGIKVRAVPDTSARFMVIEGTNLIYSRIKQMINETKNQLSIISTVSGLARADRFGLLDSHFKHPQLSNVQFRLLTHLTEDNVHTIHALLDETPKTELRFEIRNPDLGSRLFPRMVIRDEEEIMFFINPKVEYSASEQDNLCLWTNCSSLIHSFLTLFEELWRNSTNIQRKIVEIETGKPTSKTFVIREADSVKKKYYEIMRSASKEILLLTSSTGLIQFWKEIAKLENFDKKNVSVKIMAPIVKENWKVMEQLSKSFAVKHVPIHYRETAIVDGKHLFQFKNPQMDFKSTSHFEKAFYTNDDEWVKTMNTALNDIWNSAQKPSPITLESIIGPYGFPIFPLPKKDLRAKLDFKVIDFKMPGTITEKDVLNKIIHAKKMSAKDPSRDVSRSYASFAVAVINPHNQSSLPHMMIQAYKHDKKSSFGEADVITVYRWLKTPTGHAYVPVAVVTDNPNVQPLLRMVCAGAPAGMNVQVVKKDELSVRIHGKTLVAGWTVPIPLYPPQFVLPPACLLIEGYGAVRTIGFTLSSPSGYRIQLEDNAFDAFVTFINPESKYSGAGTEGTLVRDSIITIMPPSYSPQ
jgi:sugar-specific transcriptional regulator TrmB